MVPETARSMEDPITSLNGALGTRLTGGGSVVWGIRDLWLPDRRVPLPQRDRQPRRSEAEGERMPPPPG